MIKSFFKKIKLSNAIFSKTFFNSKLLIRLLVIYFLFICFFGKKGIINIIINYSRMQYIQNQVEELKKEKEYIIDITKTENSESKIELKAREDLGLIKPGEKIIIFSKNKK